MYILWTYLKPYQCLVTLALSLASISQVLALIDPIIFGKIIDEYAIRPADKADQQLLAGVWFLLALAGEQSASGGVAVFNSGGKR